MRFEYQGTSEYLTPKAVAALRNLEGVPLYHHEQEMRHPLEIYLTTFSDVLEQKLSLIELLDEASAELPYLGNKKPGWEKKIVAATDHWLDSVIQHIDSCKGILSSFFGEDDAEQKSKCISSFSKSVEQYRKQVATIVNLIKHKHRFLRVIYFHWVGGFVPGYFVEGVVQEGVLGPDPVVHTNANTAISYNRDIPFQLANLFFISAVLARHVYEITKRPAGVDTEKPFRDPNLEKVIKKVSIMPLTFFPDEVKKPVPFVKYQQKHNGTVRVLIEMPSRCGKPQAVPEKSQISTTFRIGEIAKTCKLPYFGTEVPV